MNSLVGPVAAGAAEGATAAAEQGKSLVDVLDADRSDLSEIDFSTRPTQRFHGSIPAMIDAIQALMKQDARILLTAPNQGEVERLGSARMIGEEFLSNPICRKITFTGSTQVGKELIRGAAARYSANDFRGARDGKIWLRLVRQIRRQT